jgi:hypothetical protein
MRRFLLLCVAGALLGSAAVLVPTHAADEERLEIPNFNPDGRIGWGSNRLASDDFLPPKSGPGPVLADPQHPYIPNQSPENSTYRVADLSNPILQEWVKEPMRKANEWVLAGKVPFIARERCWPIGVPGFVIWNRGQPLRFIQTRNQVWMINELYGITRRVYLNVGHTPNYKPSWWGESVGHYEGDTLVVDTIGVTDRTFVDYYRTPHTEQIHVVERFKLIDGGKTLHVDVNVEDPGAFTTAWNAIQQWDRRDVGPHVENLCEPANEFFYGYEVAPLPKDENPDF